MLRGESPRSTHETLLQREIVEFVLSSEAGYSRRDLFGVDRYVVGHEPRHDVAASCRRVLARHGRRKLAAGVVGMSVVAFVYGAATSSWVGVVVGAVLLALGYYVDRVAPASIFDRPGPVVYRERHVEDGMTEDEAMRRFGIHSEREELRAEKIQEERRKAERKAKSRRP